MIFYGRNACKESLKSKLQKPSEVFIDKNGMHDPKIKSIIETCKENSIRITPLHSKEIKTLTKSDDHQGVAFNINYKYFSLKDLKTIFNEETEGNKGQAFIYLIEGTYEHNIGAIIRSAELSGFSGAILDKNHNITPTIAKTSAGAIFHLPIFRENIFNTIKEFKDNAFIVYGVERGGSVYYETDLTGNSLFIIGGEDKGISESVQNKCDQLLEIPQFGKVNSLNMSVAASIVMFERLRQNSVD